MLKHLDTTYVLIAICLSFITYLFAAATYYWLAFKPLEYVKSILIQLAAMFANRILPAGSGALGVNYLYLKKQKHTNAQATSIIAINNLLGFIGHGIILIVLVTVIPGVKLSLKDVRFDPTIVLVGMTGAALILLLVYKIANLRIKKAFLNIKIQITSFNKRPQRVLLALLSSMALTLVNVLTLYFCALALHININLADLIIIFTFGITASTAVPTPGGLGGFEAGLAAGFILYGIGNSAALTIAVLYRLITYWLSVVIGAAALIYAKKRHYI